jgi:catechol-2,3-dioxygenase
VRAAPRYAVWGEIAFRVSNLDAMHQFYELVIRLPLMTRVPNCAFFKIAGATAVTLKSSRCENAQIAPGYRATGCSNFDY